MDKTLAPCPCGRPLEELIITEGIGSYAYVCGMCCGEWNIEFHTGFTDLDSEECKQKAKAAWNRALRAKELGGINLYESCILEPKGHHKETL